MFIWLFLGSKRAQFHVYAFLPEKPEKRGSILMSVHLRSLLACVGYTTYSHKLMQFICEVFLVFTYTKWDLNIKGRRFRKQPICQNSVITCVFDVKHIQLKASKDTFLSLSPHLTECLFSSNWADSDRILRNFWFGCSLTAKGKGRIIANCLQYGC